MQDFLKIFTNTVNAVRYGNLANKIDNVQNKDFQPLAESINRMIDTLNDREKMILEYKTEQRFHNEFLEKIINCLSEGIIVVDSEQKIIKITPKVASWAKETRGNLLNKKLNDILTIKSQRDFKELSDDEVVIKNSSFPFIASSTELLTKNQKNYVLTIKNITNQLELEKVKEDFVATLTHDLKVPIIAEANTIDFLINGNFGDLSESQMKVLGAMKKSNQELLELVQTLLISYKLENSELFFDFHEFDLSELIKEVISEMSGFIEKSGESVDIKTKTKTKIYADKLQLKRVLKNLITNAIIHGVSSKPVEIKYIKRNNFVKISIKDYGKGIAKADISKIFDKFFSTTKQFRKAGTGLGLYLCKQIVDAHGGKISVRSIENVETEFCIEIPFPKN